MKIKNLFLAGLFVLGMSACSNNDEPVGGDTDGKYDTYMTLTLKAPSMSNTKTSEGPDGPIAGEGAENDIKNIQVYLVDGNGIIKHASAPGIAAGSTKTEAFEVPEGDYSVYAVVNVGSTLLGAENANISTVCMTSN